MAACLRKLPVPVFTSHFPFNTAIFVRHGHRARGKPPGVALSLKERLELLRYKDPSLHYRVDIGFPAPHLKRSEELGKRLQHVRAQKADANLEKLSRERQLLIDLDSVKDEWYRRAWSYHVRKIADHYGIYEHLFGDAYFSPRKKLSIFYEDGELLHPVLYGNTIKPNEAKTQPSVTFESKDDFLWTLVLTNPDGHLSQQNSEYVHWFIGNIPGNKIENGEVVVDYLQPFPPRGTGYHRLIFVLYKQTKKLDFSSLKRQQPCVNLSERTFSTLDFYRERQDDLTPAGLAFFQSDWDRSLTDFYHNVLNMREPVFEYDFPAPYIRPQEMYPIKRPFNIYMDRYRDPKETRKYYFVQKLKTVHPFRPPPKRLPYPNAEPFVGYVPSWLKLELEKRRTGLGRINEV